MKVVVSAAIIENKGLLIVRSEKAWILVGGKPEPGESDLEALCREVRQELSGTKLKNVRKYRNFSGKTPHTGDVREFKIYLAEIDGALGPPSQEVKEIAWYRRGDPYILSEVTEQVFLALEHDGYI
jgi:8-oxo-dGTP diphosphatase